MLNIEDDLLLEAREIGLPEKIQQGPGKRNGDQQDQRKARRAGFPARMTSSMRYFVISG